MARANLRRAALGLKPITLHSLKSVTVLDCGIEDLMEVAEQ